jgi:hypothetical protein
MSGNGVAEPRGKTKEPGDQGTITEQYPTYLQEKRRKEALRWRISIFIVIILCLFLYLESIIGHGDFKPLPWWLGAIFFVILGSLVAPTLYQGSPKNAIQDCEEQQEPSTGAIPYPIPVTEEVWFQRVISYEIFTITWTIGFILIEILLIDSNDPVCCLTVFAPICLTLYYCISFWRLDVRCTRSFLTLHYSWSQLTTIQLSSIRSIRAVAIHPLQEFRGWGRLHRKDGTVGYISSGKVGVRIHLVDGSTYVVTIRNPQSLVNFINWWKSVAKRDRIEHRRSIDLEHDIPIS